MSSSESELWTSVTGTNPACRCVQDPRLTLAARRHATDLAASGRPPAENDVEHLRFALLTLGGIDYALQPLVTAVDAPGLESLRSFVLAHGDRWTHCGLGLAGGTGNQIAVWIGVERLVELDPLPVRPEPGIELVLNGRTRAPNIVPVQLFLGLPGGGISRLEASSRWSKSTGGTFRVAIPVPAPGRYELEMLVDSGRGLETAALFPLYVGVQPDPGPLIALDAPMENGVRSPADLLAHLINRERSRAGLAPLERAPRLDRVADRHTGRMVELGFFGHRAPDGTLLGDRLLAAGLAPERSAENIARSRSVSRVHRNLMSSPSHRINIVDPQFTHIGVGVAQDGADVVVTEIFVRW